jgi:hypothetical protein
VVGSGWWVVGVYACECMSECVGVDIVGVRENMQMARLVRIYTQTRTHAHVHIHTHTRMCAHNSLLAQQVEKWPANPVDRAISWIKARDPSLVVADLGCGEARIAATVPNTVHSFDLVARNSHGERFALCFFLLQCS